MVKASIDEEASTAEVIECRPGAAAAPLWPAVGFSNLQMLQVKGLKKWSEHDMNPCELMMGEGVGNCWFENDYIHWIELGSLVVYDYMLNIVSCDMQVVPYIFWIDSDIRHSAKGVFVTCGTSFSSREGSEGLQRPWEVSTSCNCRAAKANRGQRMPSYPNKLYQDESWSL